MYEFLKEIINFVSLCMFPKGKRLTCRFFGAQSINALNLDLFRPNQIRKQKQPLREVTLHHTESSLET